MKDSLLKNIEQKYWDAESSLEEEKILKDLVDSSEKPEPHLKILFDFFREEKENTSNLDIELLEVVSERKGSKIFTLNQWISIAAGIILIIGFIGLMRSFQGEVNKSMTANYALSNTEHSLHEPQTPEEALEHVLNSLQLVSETMNTSQDMSQKGLRDTQIFDILTL